MKYTLGTNADGRTELTLRAGQPGAGLRIDEFAAELGLELFGVGALGEAKDVHVAVVAADARAQRQVVAKQMDRDVVLTNAALRRERHLVRLFSVDRALAELAFAVDHGASRVAGGFLVALRKMPPTADRGAKTWANCDPAPA
jgi:hypothetical protein